MTFTTCKGRHVRGVALVLILAFIVLLTGVVVAFFTRTTADRQLAQSSFNDTKSDLLAHTGLAIVIGDFRQEIANAPAVTTANVQPQRSGTPAGGAAIPNLVRRSVRGGASSMPAPGVASNASASNSETDTSMNGRAISMSRWNRHYLVPRSNAGTAVDPTPISSFTAPDWVFVLPNGPEIITAPSPDVIGRYAYAVYDVGGLLDVNVAGFPFHVPPSSSATPSPTLTDVGRKGTVAFADLTALATSPTVVTSTTTPSAYLTVGGINDVIGWRNYATVQPGGSFGASTFDSPTTSPGTGSRFSAHFLGRTNGFLTTAQTLYNNRTDQSVVSRTQLVALRSSLGFSQNVLQYLGTFSRERNISTASSAPRFAIELIGTVLPNANVKQNFGLQWQTDHWVYTGKAQNVAQSTITPDASAAADFFQRLSFGMSTTTMETVLTAGASIIDQYDADDTTTAIEYAAPASSPAPSPVVNPRAHGREALASPTPAAAPPPPAGFKALNRPFRSVGEFGYAYKTATAPLDFHTAGSADSKLLDLFTFNTATPRGGAINLNTGNIPVLATILMGAVTAEPSASSPTATASVLTRTNAIRAAAAIVTETSGQAAVGREDIPRLAAAVPNSVIGSTTEEKQTVARALAELSQTRTWNLMIDLVAQTGRYPSTAANLSQFLVEGEKRYWLHIAIDRVTGEVIDQQLEPVHE